MARVFLIVPPSPRPTTSPLLSICHLAAALRSGGHDVGVADAAAPRGPSDTTRIRELAAAFEPDVVGVHVKTDDAHSAYAVASVFRDRWPLVAGGPHATVRPAETIRAGFTFAIRGEAEEALAELADAIDGGRAPESVSGVSFRDSSGKIRHTRRSRRLETLDALPDPLGALDLFDPAWYRAAGPVPPMGVLASRGCPSRCRFCCNAVTGRRLRARDPEAVAREVATLRDRFGLSAFSFFDDSFMTGEKRLLALCGALEELGPPLAWTSSVRPCDLSPAALEAMRRAGCRGIDIGLESADPARLRRIGKRAEPERVLVGLEWCRSLEILGVVNLMFGWPDETDAELDTAMEFIDRAAGKGCAFGARGVLVPYPGTAIYEDHHRHFGFTDWWLREPLLSVPPPPETWDDSAVGGFLANDPVLDRNFFRMSPERQKRAAGILAREAHATIDALSGSTGPSPHFRAFEAL